MNEEKTKSMRLVDEFEQMQRNNNNWKPKVHKGFEVQCRKVGFLPVVDITTNCVQYCHGLFDFGDWLMEQLNESRKQVAELRAEKIVLRQERADMYIMLERVLDKPFTYLEEIKELLAVVGGE